ncbi:hypothetical protein LINPERHAP1_LOCUS9737 [Linum perenne]
MWILDTGASDHITCSRRYFTSSKPVFGVNVYLPDSSSVSVSHIGTAKLPNGLVIYDVLLVPNFHFNLVSISKLTNDLPVSLSFHSDKCHIQDLMTSKMIGLATQVKGLYHLHDSTQPHQTK